ncbi:MAG TPA: Stk1 family PASTA domain-containing Ser/Thr kinase [Firmicutes bacterium]|nr:Stk1 family PASTA domain-containing Ser/Thr kinase [Bacillota bacterium]
MDKYIGKMLDNRYEILEVIGRGGMAVVYKAKCHRLNRFVAVKILKEELAQDEEFRQRFRDESQAVAMLSHPNIVSVYDVSRSGDVEYIVMELIDGITLKDYLERQSPLGWKETTFFALQIAKALEHAHSRGIIHRDIKPQNIMVLRDGTVKVADFGIARQAASTNTYNLREAIGSVHYVSPEQARGSHIDNRSDLYSLGVVMYEMLTGRLPFVGDTPLEVALQHINSVPLPPSDYVPNIPKTLEHIVMKAMAPVPADRYNNATELIQDIERFRNDPHYQVDVPRTAVPDSNLRDPGETQVIQYTSQLASAGARNSSPTRHTPPVRPRPLEEEEEEDEEEPRRSGKKRRISSSLLFTILAVSIFVIGAGFFIAAVMNPFGGDDSGRDDPDAASLTAPKLVGRQYTDVIGDRSLEEQGIAIVEQSREYDEEAEEGEIISQTPEEGDPLDEDKTIYVVVSLGPNTGEMPDVVNQEWRQARIAIDAAAREAGIQITYGENVEEYSDTYLEGYVIESDPKKGEELKDGDVVTLTVSRGPEIKEVSVPDVEGDDVESARSALSQRNLQANVTERESDRPAGEVLEQSPKGGTTAEEGSTVDLVVSSGPAEEPQQVEKIFTILLTPDLNDPDSPIQVVVTVDGQKQYDQQHTLDEGEIEVRLTATEGESHTIQVMQNGVNTTTETVTF